MSFMDILKKILLYAFAGILFLVGIFLGIMAITGFFIGEGYFILVAILSFIAITWSFGLFDVASCSHY